MTLNTIANPKSRYLQRLMGNALLIAASHKIKEPTDKRGPLMLKT